MTGHACQRLPTRALGVALTCCVRHHLPCRNPLKVKSLNPSRYFPTSPAVLFCSSIGALPWLLCYFELCYFSTCFFSVVCCELVHLLFRQRFDCKTYVKFQCRFFCRRNGQARKVYLLASAFCSVRNKFFLRYQALLPIGSGWLGGLARSLVGLGFLFAIRIRVSVLCSSVRACELVADNFWRGIYASGYLCVVRGW